MWLWLGCLGWNTFAKNRLRRAGAGDILGLASRRRRLPKLTSNVKSAHSSTCSMVAYLILQWCNTYMQAFAIMRANFVTTGKSCSYIVTCDLSIRDNQLSVRNALYQSILNKKTEPFLYSQTSKSKSISSCLRTGLQNLLSLSFRYRGQRQTSITKQILLLSVRE